MKRPVKVCFWVTTLQANVFSLAHHLCRLPQFEVVLAVPGLHAYLKEPINRLYPLTCPLIERDDRRATDSLKRFGADVTVVDNHYPPERLSPLLVNVWHGFGWRGPEGRAQFKDVYRSIKRLTGVAPDNAQPGIYVDLRGGNQPPDPHPLHRVPPRKRLCDGASLHRRCGSP